MYEIGTTTEEFFRKLAQYLMLGKKESLVTARKRSLGQGNIFTPVCHSVHRGGMRGCSVGWCMVAPGGCGFFPGGMHGFFWGGVCGFFGEGGMHGFFRRGACMLFSIGGMRGFFLGGMHGSFLGMHA